MSFIGNIEGVSLASILQALSQDKLTGIASVTKDGSCVRLVIMEGRIVYANAVGQKRLGERLIRDSLLTQEQLDRALREQRERHKHSPLASVLFELGLVSRRQLEEHTKAQIREVFDELLSWAYGIVSFKPRSFDDQLFIVRDGLATEQLLLKATVSLDEAQHESDTRTIEAELLEFLP